jgi:signal-transduction protein with cAMP-binding, CBS, and nucleotidyltransferase domain
VDRLDTLGARQVLTATSHGEIVLAYDHLMQMRLKHHATAIRDHSAADNTINLKSITHLEQAMLQQTFNHVATIQRKISYDFLGGT